jgi:hypothetical protein
MLHRSKRAVARNRIAAPNQAVAGRVLLKQEKYRGTPQKIVIFQYVGIVANSG